MKSIRPLLFLGALSLLIAWLMWPDQNQPDSPTTGEPGNSFVENLAPATLEEVQASAPQRTEQVIALPKEEPPVTSEPFQPKDPKDETGKVTVRIVDAFGNHVRHGEVLVMQKHKVLETLSIQEDDGLFRCELGASEAYEFMVKPESLRGGLMPQLLRSRGTQKEGPARDPFDLKNFARAYVRLKAKDDVSVELLVAAPVRAYGRVLGPNGNPLEGIMVALSALDRNAGGLAEASMTNELGEFAFLEVFPGNHRLLVHVAPNQVPEGENWNPPAPQDAKIHPGQDFDWGDTRIGSGQCSVSGWIVNQDGFGFAGLPVLCYSNKAVEEGLDPQNFTSQLGRTMTDAEGRFTLTGLEAGPALITLTPEYNPRFVLGAGHPAMWEPNMEVNLILDGPHVDLGELVVEESRPFLLTGNLQFDDAWLATDGHRKEDLRIYVSQQKGEALPEGIRRNAVRKQRVPIDWATHSYQSAIETPMTTLVLTFKLPGYEELKFSVRPEALQTWAQDIQIPQDFK